MTEVVNIVRYMANSVNIPLIACGDDGFGGALAAYRTTREVIGAGASGIYISDRKHLMLARAPHNLLEVLSQEEYLGKIGAVVEARNKDDKDFIIIARIDAGATLGDEEVIARAKACHELGVDIIYPHARPPESKFGERDKETLRQLYRTIGAPQVLIWGQGPDTFVAKDYEEIGAKLWVPGRFTEFIEEAVLDSYQRFYDTGLQPIYTFSSPGKKLSSNRLRKLKGLDYWCDVEKKYVVK
jgi:methylisocitrate lyase